MPRGYCQKRSVEWFVERATAVHGEKYDYSEVTYVDNRTPVVVICKTCGHKFKIIPFNHFNGIGCKPCFCVSRRKPVEKFLEQAHDIHGNLYDYSSMQYVDTNTKIAIICTRCKKTFYQMPSLHIGQGNGCPHCISRGEKKIAAILNVLGIKYEKEARFPDCRGIGGKPLRFDFYIPSLNICIEYDGRQHWDKSSKFWNQWLKKHDKIKNNFCKSKGIKLRRISNADFEKIKPILLSLICP
jgi:protein-arginine kinase activator protein McsA